MCNLKLIVTWYIHRVETKTCVSSPPFLPARFELYFCEPFQEQWKVQCHWAPLAAASCGSWRAGTGYFWSSTVVGNTAWVFQSGQVHVSFQCNLFVFLSVITIFALSEASGNLIPCIGERWCNADSVSAASHFCRAPSTLTEGLLQQAQAGHGHSV